MDTIEDPELKRQKLGEKLNEETISSLPDEVLGHILSFLPTKTAVQTCILSKKWRNIWNSVSSFDFDFDFHDFGDLSRKHKVQSFIDSVLILRSYQCIRRFRLHFNSVVDCGFSLPYNFNTWVRAAIRNGVEELDLGNSLKLFEMPRILFSCETIRTLKFYGGFAFKIPEAVCLPRLKVLHFRSLRFLTDDDIKKFLSGSHVLEELLIDTREIDTDLVKELCVESSSLKSLTIRRFSQYEHCSLIIDAPKLEFLELIDYVSNEFEIVNLSSLVKATIDVNSDRLSFHSYYNRYAVQVFQLLIQISHVKTLSLFGNMVEEIHFADTGINYPCFHNLRHLEVTVKGNSWPGLLEILRKSPNLEIFIFRHWKKLQQCRNSFSYPYGSSWEKCVSQCFFQYRCDFPSLKTLEFQGFEGNEVDMEVIKYLLKNAKVLKKLRITSTDINSMEESKLLKKLLMFPRASSTCEVIFS